MARGRVTIRDVAQRAGVSISTVSHTFSGIRPISEPTRQRVKQAASDLGYEANPSARSLRTGRSGLVGLVLRPRHAVDGTPDRSETFNRLLGSVTTEMLRRHYAVVYVPDVDDPALGSVPMDACIVAHPYRNDEAVTVLRRRGIPIALIDADPDRDIVPWTVRLDYRAGMESLLDHLTLRGATSIALFSGAEENAWNLESRETFASWCQERGVDDRIEIVQENLAHEVVVEMARSLLSSADRPEAVIIAPSDYAEIFASVAIELGLRIPEDTMIASLIDTEHTRRSSPPITAVDLRHEEVAAHAVELIFALLEEEDPPMRHRVITPNLLTRESTNRAAPSH